MLAIAITLISGFIQSNQLIDIIEKKLYQHNIIYTEQTPYQKIIVTAQKGRIQFYINGAIQFDSIDEYRYHESLVHPVMNIAQKHEEILIIGGGDGMALREVLKYQSVKAVTLVDLDPSITKLFKDNPLLSQLNNNAYDNHKVTVVNKDAWKFIEQSKQLYDVIIIDLPDPNNLSLSRLYSQTFYQLLKSHLAYTGAIVTQSTSPIFSKKAFWSINKTLENTGFYTLPYHAYIPSFGEWGFNIASHIPIKIRAIDPTIKLYYLNNKILQTMQYFAPDMDKVVVESNQISKHKLLYYYEKGWDEWYDR